LPKNQARKLYTYAKEQLDLLKNPVVNRPIVEEKTPVETTPVEIIEEAEVIEEIQAEEVTSFATQVIRTRTANYSSCAFRI
jgi:hypothetical protein